MQIEQNYSLKKYNTFGVEVKAKYFANIGQAEQVLKLIKTTKFLKEKHFILGGGSNLLFKTDFNGLVIHSNIKHLSIFSENSDNVVVKAGSGEIWDDFVKWTIERNYAGLENLSLIPGTVGAAPVQNIGAYGTEVKDSIVAIEGINLEKGELIKLQKEECDFSYRDSIFKHALKNNVFITYVYFELSKKISFKLDYGNLKNELNHFSQLNLQHVRQAVINLRKSKLPDPKKFPNAGSFFKNPVVDQSVFMNLKQTFPEIVFYNLDKEKVKLAAAWLIDHAGWKGKRIDKIGVHKHQALVIVNYADASGEELIEFSEKIRADVKAKFDLELENEVLIV